VKIMEHKTCVVRCDTEKCKGTGDDKREIRVDFIPEPPTQAQAIVCPYCRGTIERNIPGRVMRVTGDRPSGGLSVFPRKTA
jgi:hypothetical protein